MQKKISVRSFYKPAPWTGEITADLRWLKSILEHDNMNLTPAYQRGSVWSWEQQEAFMGHLLQGGDILPIIVQRVPDSGQGEVLDGKQRLEAMLTWLDGRISAVMDDGTRLHVDDVEFSGLERVTFRFKYVNMPWEERKRFYVRLNSAGTPHTADELKAALAAKAEVLS